MKKNGFISTTLIYSFFIVFLSLMAFLINSYSNTRYLLEEYKYDIKNSFAETSLADINLYFMVWNSDTKDYEIEKKIPQMGYIYEPEYSYCKNGSELSYVNGNIAVSAYQKDVCYAYFNELDKDIDLKIYTKESANGELERVKSIPSDSYELTSLNCSNNASIEFDDELRKFIIESTDKTTCEALFTRKEVDVKLHYYKEDAKGVHTFNGLRYTEVSEIPGVNYSFNNYVCEKDGTVISYNENGIKIDSSIKNECDVYFSGGNEKVEIIIMREDDEGIKGYTTGKLYSRTYSIPTVGYKYMGYLCDNPDARLSYRNGILEGISDTQTVCRAYFNRASENVFIHLYLAKSDGSNESVSSVPPLGYIYNPAKSRCNKNTTKLVVDNNIVVAEATEEDECYVFFDLAISDIKINVYVMNRETRLYELSDVPYAGYELYNAGCTNGALIEYVNGKLEVTNEGPTVCTVYFR